MPGSLVEQRTRTRSWVGPGSAVAAAVAAADVVVAVVDSGRS